eukprot:1981752-Amphidinium_carterae.1
MMCVLNQHATSCIPRWPLSAAAWDPFWDMTGKRPTTREENRKRMYRHRVILLCCLLLSKKNSEVLVRGRVLNGDSLKVLHSAGLAGVRLGRMGGGSGNLPATPSQVESDIQSRT